MQERIYEITKKDKKTVIEAGLKLAEETGELAEAILVTSNAHACGYKEGITSQDVLEEVADVLIVASSIAYKAGFTVEDLTQAIAKKLGKWELKLSNDNK